MDRMLLLVFIREEVVVDEVLVGRWLLVEGVGVEIHF